MTQLLDTIFFSAIQTSRHMWLRYRNSKKDGTYNSYSLLFLVLTLALGVWYKPLIQELTILVKSKWHLCLISSLFKLLDKTAVNLCEMSFNLKTCQKLLLREIYKKNWVMLKSEPVFLHLQYDIFANICWNTKLKT